MYTRKHVSKIFSQQKTQGKKDSQSEPKSAFTIDDNSDVFVFISFLFLFCFTQDDDDINNRI